ncbi:ABC transporter ATP-binding protein [Phaeobacter sp. B1627]|uniref:ABC transporter ATP-binding protein n=1 Tax=Phaeobacter sp. B1627 TaxID=2583809 RepID=UPI00111AC08B|nr:ATP-binding cassette domain-containing protein [Phaeobacter sp. B1627]TNJ47424.1 ABC transporter ATP-binding protein [Phaeobacter sp. B1627]
MIHICITSKSFDGKEILRNIRFEIAAGETVALLGPSGIGKSTVLRIVAGLDPEYVGHIIRPEAISYIFQEPTLLPWRNALDNLRLVHSGVSRERARQMLERVGLGGKASAFPTQLSLGQQRRLALARAFVVPCELLIMDEPFTSLDAAWVDDMMGLTRDLISETRPATLMVTHARQEADVLADRLLELSGTPATLEA